MEKYYKLVFDREYIISKIEYALKNDYWEYLGFFLLRDLEEAMDEKEFELIDELLNKAYGIIISENPIDNLKKFLDFLKNNNIYSAEANADLVELITNFRKEIFIVEPYIMKKLEEDKLDDTK